MMQTPQKTTQKANETGARRSGEIRFSARFMVFGWLLFTTAIGLVTLIVTVNSTLHADAAREANRHVTQELEEFQQFAQTGVDPQTAQPFTSFQRLVEVFLSRQEAGRSEVLLGIDPGGNAIGMIAGSRVPPPEVHDLRAETELLSRLAEEPSGVAETPAGELRWGAVRVTTESGADDGYLIVGDYVQTRYGEVAHVTVVVTWISLGVLLLTGIIGWIVAGRILHPIRRMRRAASRITQADLSRRIPVHGQDELAQLAATFNQLLDRVESAFQHEQQFVDEAARKLRTPIASARSRLQEAEASAPGHPSLLRVRAELDQLDAIVADLISLAKAERPDFLRIEEPADIGWLTRAIAREAQRIADRRWVLTACAEGHAQLDAERIGQAVLELAENAVHHTAPGDEIRMASEIVQEDGQPAVRFSVTDNGPGVAPEDAELIFERFGRGSEEHPHSGAGLGLAIVRAIADGHDGWVSVDSVPGRGAMFAITVPLHATPVKLDPATAPIATGKHLKAAAR